ncbi:unnamed protein product, partial [Nesidiocoris tenuis]
VVFYLSIRSPRVSTNYRVESFMLESLMLNFIALPPSNHFGICFLQEHARRYHMSDSDTRSSSWSDGSTRSDGRDDTRSETTEGSDNRSTSKSSRDDYSTSTRHYEEINSKKRKKSATEWYEMFATANHDDIARTNDTSKDTNSHTGAARRTPFYAYTTAPGTSLINATTTNSLQPPDDDVTPKPRSRTSNRGSMRAFGRRKESGELETTTTEETPSGSSASSKRKRRPARRRMDHVTTFKVKNSVDHERKNCGQLNPGMTSVTVEYDFWSFDYRHSTEQNLFLIWRIEVVSLGYLRWDQEPGESPYRSSGFWTKPITTCRSLLRTMSRLYCRLNTDVDIAEGKWPTTYDSQSRRFEILEQATANIGTSCAPLQTVHNQPLDVQYASWRRPGQ